MAFQSIVTSNGSMSDLDSEINPDLANYPGARVVSIGLDYGSSNNRSTILLDLQENSGDAIVQAFSVSDSSITDLQSEVQEWLDSSPGTILGLAMGRSNDRWKALILYSEDDLGSEYQARAARRDSASEMQEAIDEGLKGALQVPAFGFSCSSNWYGVIWIQSP